MSIGARGFTLVILWGALASSTPGRADPIPKPRTAEEAIGLAISPLPLVNSFELRATYTDIRAGGDATTLDLNIGVVSQYALIPGLKIRHVTTALIADQRFVSLHTPFATANGLTDLSLFDIPIYGFTWGGIGVGVGALLPSATNPALGEGKLQLGPSAGIGVRVTQRFVLGVFVFNSFSVAGDPSRPEVNRLLVQPVIGYLLPYASSLRFDPFWFFDWEKGGRATIPLNLSIAHAFSPHLVVSAQPVWVVTGENAKNDVSIRVEFDYLGW